MGGAVLLIPPLLAVIFGHISLSKMKADSAIGGKGLAITGLILGYLAIICLLGFLAIFIGFAALAGSSMTELQDLQELEQILPGEENLIPVD